MTHTEIIAEAARELVRATTAWYQTWGNNDARIPAEARVRAANKALSEAVGAEMAEAIPKALVSGGM